MKKLQKIRNHNITKRVLSLVVLLSFLFVALHSALHTPHDHLHDSECSVYVLEQLFGAMDATVVASELFHFTPYIFLLFTLAFAGEKAEKLFSIRAPPSI